MNKTRGIIGLVFLLVLVGCETEEEAAKRYKENAVNHAKELGLRNPLISCDPGVPYYCTISWETCTIPAEASNAMCGRIVAEYDCAGRGCASR